MELKEVIGDWSLWIDGEFGEFTLGKTEPSQILDERSLKYKLMSDSDEIWFALGFERL